MFREHFLEPLDIAYMFRTLKLSVIPKHLLFSCLTFYENAISLERAKSWILWILAGIATVSQ